MSNNDSTFAGLTAAEWTAKAQGSRQNSADSFERSDTDGLLSQWASDQMAIKHQRNARIAEVGGIEMAGIVDLATGEIVKGEWVDGQYGAFYRPFDRSVALIFPSNARNEKTRAANNAKKGIAEVQVVAPAALNTRTGDAYPVEEGTWRIAD
jgi:hypothetical protein